MSAFIHQSTITQDHLVDGLFNEWIFIAEISTILNSFIYHLPAIQYMSIYLYSGGGWGQWVVSKQQGVPIKRFKQASDLN